MKSNLVAVTRRMPDLGYRLLADAGLTVRRLDAELPPPRTELLEAIRGATAAVTFIGDRVDGDFLDAAGDGLRVVANYAVGFDNIDLEACRSRGIIVTNTPGVLANATADLAWTLILATARRAAEGDRLVRTGKWGGAHPTELLGLEMRGSTLGIVGAGQIGTATARRSLGFDMKVVYTHPRPNPDLEGPLSARRVELDELLQTADIVSLHIPMRPENRHLINARRLALLKDGAILINTARGAVIDEAALVQELRTGRIRAGLDVYEFEPRLTDGLADLENVVLLPHIGSATVRTRNAMAELVAKNVIDVLAGGQGITRVL